MKRGGNKWRYSFPFPSVVRKDITPVMGWDPMIVNKINKRDIKMDVFFFLLNFSIGSPSSIGGPYWNVTWDVNGD